MDAWAEDAHLPGRTGSSPPELVPSESTKNTGRSKGGGDDEETRPCWAQIEQRRAQNNERREGVAQEQHAGRAPLLGERAGPLKPPSFSSIVCRVAGGALVEQLSEALSHSGKFGITLEELFDERSRPLSPV